MSKNIEIDKNSTLVVGYSGGKDSTATLIYLKELGYKNIIPVFADTAWEAEETYKYVDYVESALGVEIKRLHAKCGQIFKKPNPRVPDPERRLTFAELCNIKGRFPSSQRRFCTTELKMKVQKKFIESLECKNIISVSGVRREESPKRANLPEYIEHDLFMEVPVWLPIISWTWEEVFALHDKHGIKPNPLYKQGFARVGCFPCIMSNKSELALIAKYHPERFDVMHDMECEARKKIRDKSNPSKQLSTAFFSHDTVSAKYRRQSCADGFRYANALDVRDWAIGASPDNKTETFNFMDDFEDVEAPSCNSIYGLCE